LHANDEENNGYLMYIPTRRARNERRNEKESHDQVEARHTAREGESTDWELRE